MNNNKEKRRKELQDLIGEFQKTREELNEKLDEYFSEVRKLDKEIFRENNQKYIGRCFKWNGDSLSGVLSEKFVYKIFGPIEKGEAQNCLAVFEKGIKVIKLRCFEPTKFRLMTSNDNSDDTFLERCVEITEEEFRNAFDEKVEYMRELMENTGENSFE